MNIDKSELVPKQVFNFVGYQFRSERGQGQTHPRVLADPTIKDKRTHDRSGLPRLEANVLDRLAYSYRKTSATRPVTQWHLKNSLRVRESPEKVIPIPKSLAPT